jgi:predicted SAM-dependent methyltransferase
MVRKMKINKEILIIGNGPQPKPKIKNTKITALDIVKYPTIDVVWNLEELPLPFEKNKFDEIWASHVIEHVPRDKFDKLMEEIHRILRNGGKVKIRVPFFAFFAAFHVDHKNFFTHNSFNKYEPKHPLHDEKKVSFKILEKKIIFGNDRRTKIFNPLLNPIINLSQDFYCRFFCWILPSEEIRFELQALK